eukprot:177086-Amphidinium_carterae.1
MELEDGTTLEVYKGSQTIDGLWKHMRAAVTAYGVSCPARIDSLLRVAQWRHWVGPSDAWVALAKSLHA